MTLGSRDPSYLGVAHRGGRTRNFVTGRVGVEVLAG